MFASKLILASTSRYRRELLARLSLKFECDAPRIDESQCGIAEPADRALLLARSKATEVSKRHPGAYVLGSDQVCSLEYPDDSNQPPVILHKPGNESRQREQLEALSGNEVCFDTAVCLCRDARVVGELNIPTRVRFRRLNATEIANYVEREPATDCAGGFKVEGLGISLFEWIRSDDPTALIGLPLIATTQLLGQAV